MQIDKVSNASVCEFLSWYRMTTLLLFEGKLYTPAKPPRHFRLHIWQYLASKNPSKVSDASALKLVNLPQKLGEMFTLSLPV